MPLTFHEADTLFRQDKLNELVADSEGRRFLKLRSLNRTEYLERLFRMADIPRPDVGARQLFEVAFDADIDVTVIEACARGIYNEERERRRANEAELVNHPATTPHGGAWRVTRGRLTTRHSASSYGHPVIVIDGEPYGPADILGVADTVAQVEGAASEAYRRAIAAGYPAVEPVAQLRKDGRL